jgi:hypothetical protein
MPSLALVPPKESEGNKVIELVRELCSVLDQAKSKRKSKRKGMGRSRISEGTIANSIQTPGLCGCQVGTLNLNEEIEVVRPRFP